jgi:hypothetical protein
MSASTALAAVSQSLRTMLRAEMNSGQGGDTPVDVTLLGLGGTGNRGINLFLHRVDEHPQLRNADYQIRTGTADTLAAPPLSLVLRYLMTAYAPPHDQLGEVPSQTLLGEAMRVFHQFPVVPKQYLDADLVDAAAELRILLVPIEVEEINRLWGTINDPYRLSVQYEVSVVQIDSTDAAHRHVPRRVERVAVPEVRAPYAPPKLESATPLTTRPGDPVRIEGQHLAGWKASVTVSGIEVGPDEALRSDVIEVALPTDLWPGFHRLQVDVARLARASWFVQVVPR